MIKILANKRCNEKGSEDEKEKERRLKECACVGGCVYEREIESERVKLDLGQSMTNTGTF